jgi:hypothetical protein
MNSRRLVGFALVVSSLGFLASSSLSQQIAPANTPFSFMAFGDVPYALPADYAKFERLLGAINTAKPNFSLFIGDIKSGSSPCSDENILKIRDYFNTLEQPLVFTPGDNEWTDCHRDAAGKFNPLERLSFVRKSFYPTASSLGKTTLRLERQSDVSDHKQMVENARWTVNNVTFATVHIVGSNNGFERNQESVAEFFARDAANVAWIKETFAKAKASNVAAVVFGFQADMFFPADAGGYGKSGFTTSLAAFSSEAATFGKPVLLVHGDSHVLVIDQPLNDAKGVVLENVTRLEVMGGAGRVHAVQVTVNPNDTGVFSFKPIWVRENLLPVSK